MKMTKQIADKIEELYRDGKRTDEIADMLDLSEAEVVRVLEEARLIG